MSQQFIARVVNYVANEVIIKGLSNSRTFQKFAVRTNKQYEELNKHGTDKITKTFEDIIKTQGEDSLSSASVSGASSSSKTKMSALKVPQRPLRGIPGFFLAFFKEVRKDLGGGGAKM